MMFHLRWAVVLFSLQVLGKYSENSHNVAVYWGQGPNQASLGEYCESGDMDIVILSFLNNFSLAANISFNFGNACGNPTGPCLDIAKDIAKCQRLGIKVMLSIGGQTANTDIYNDIDGKILGEKFYEMLGSTNGTIFPGVIIDGVDLDIEHGRSGGYPSFVSTVKKLFPSGFLVSAAPQCPFLDKNIGETILTSEIDMIFIQFYNNYCQIGEKFNYDVWSLAVDELFANKNMKIYVGIPGSEDSANHGYQDTKTIYNYTRNLANDPHFGGYSVWEVTRATMNFGTGYIYKENFLSGLRKLVSKEEKNVANDYELQVVLRKTKEKNVGFSTVIGRSGPEVIVSP